jgi:KaiC/GvpD/RAD55 family RecA-like ATPase
VPPELEAFLRLPPPQSLLVRGPPGSGKSMLSLALMESFRGRRIYVSLRVSRRGLLEQMPWLETIPPDQLEIIEASQEQDHVESHVRAAQSTARLLDERPLSREEEQFMQLPSAVQSAWSMADASHPTLIVFDSWDAIVDQYFERTGGPSEAFPSRAEVERNLLVQMMRGRISVVLVMERDSPTVLDYHVNGIVTTYRQSEQGRLERWLSLPKLRGVVIRTDLYPFTLAYGKFAAITPTAVGERYRLLPGVPDPAPEESGIWPGATDFAQGFGRLRYGAMTLIELDTEVPREIHRVLLGPILAQVLKLEGQALLISPPSMDPEDAYRSIQDFVSPQVLRERLRVLTMMPLGNVVPEMAEVFVPFHKIGWTKTGPAAPIPDDPAFLHRAHTSKHPSLIIAYLSGLETLADAAGVTISSGILAGLDAALFPKNPVHIVAVGRSGDPRLAQLSPVAEIHLRVRSPHGRIFLNGHRPYLAPLVLSQESGTEPYRLTPVL